MGFMYVDDQVNTKLHEAWTLKSSVEKEKKN